LNHDSLRRDNKVSIVQPPCSGWLANARLLTESQLASSTPTSNETVENLKHRLKLIEGEISIGNDNPELLKELYVVLHSLKNFKVITDKQLKEYISQFKKN
jgi:hypothetical protein